MDHSRKTIRISGIVTRGIGDSAFFTEIPWVKKQFTFKVGINAFPGTFNITVLPEDRKKLDRIRKARGIEIVTEDKGFCAACSFHVVVNGCIKGAVIIPQVDDYPEAQIEIIAAENIKSALSLSDGDRVEVEVYL